MPVHRSARRSPRRAGGPGRGLRGAALVAGLLLGLGLGAPPAAAASAAPSAPLAGEPDPLFDEDVEPPGYPDPAEPLNRGILRFNQAVDHWFFDPVTRAYQFAVPEPARRALRRVFLNLNSPPTLANDVLQLEWRDAGVTVGRFAINSTVGVVGLFDVAEDLGLPRHESDFGQTLRLAGVHSGPYLVLPILGPTNLRDGVGDVADSLFTPSTYFFGFGFFGETVLSQAPLAEQLVYSGTSGLSTREAHYDRLKALEESAVDFYAALKSAYYQNRQAEIWENRRHRENDWAVPY